MIFINKIIDFLYQKVLKLFSSQDLKRFNNNSRVFSKSYANHQKTKAHKKAVEELKQFMTEDDPNLENANEDNDIGEPNEEELRDVESEEKEEQVEQQPKGKKGKKNKKKKANAK